MEHIIQLFWELAKNIINKAYSGGIYNLDSFASDVRDNCEEVARAIIEAIFNELNQIIRADKSGRKECGLVLKEKDRPRELLTALGKLHIPRDYYYDKNAEKYVSVLDALASLRPYQRVGDEVGAKMVDLSTEHSYAKSAALASSGKVSRQTVKNFIAKAPTLELHPAVTEKKVVKELHIFADEDHAHLQKPRKSKGKASKIVPLVTVTEGIDMTDAKRHKTINPTYFVEETFRPKALWESVEGYLGSTYDMAQVEKIYVHGDGGGWIKNGLNDLPQTVHVMDGYHLEKRLRALDNKFPGRRVAIRLSLALRKDDKERVDAILKSLYAIAEEENQEKSITEMGTYLFGNWEAIVNRKKLNIPGSCTEGQVSHVLSKRFSRDPLGWSEAGLGKLTKLRVYKKNGGKIKAADFKEEQPATYREYAEQIIEEAMAGAKDGSLFEKETPIFDVASGTQNLLRHYGATQNTLWN